MNLPDMTGIDIAQELVKVTRPPKVIFISGEKDFETISKAGKLRPEGYLTKPLNPEMLVSRIKPILESI